VKIYAKNLTNEPYPRNPMRGIEREISKTNLVSIASAIWGMKTEHSGLIETYEKYVMSY
jgi:hypothetical protein